MRWVGSILEGMEKIAMTQAGYDRLQEQLHYLKTVRSQEISDYMGAAIADGDLRENAAYDEARMQQSENEGRIREIESQLERATIVGAGESLLGARFVLVDDKGKETELEIVGTFEANVLEGKISDVSPMGELLKGRKAGDTFEMKGRRGSTTFTVKSVTFS